MQLRPYQQSAIDKYNNGNTLFVAPTGAGKTVLIAGLIERLQGNILFLTHRQEILFQAERYFGECNIIKAGYDEDKKSRITIAQVQTKIRRAALPDIVYIINDEAHHISKGWLSILKKYPEAKKIGLTATPYRMDGKGLGKVYDNIIEVAKVKDLIGQYLVKPRYFGAKIDPDLKGLKKIGGDYSSTDLSQRVREKKIIAGTVESIKKYMAQGRHIVVYAVDCEHANLLCKEVEAMYIDGKTLDVVRKEILNRFTSGFNNLIINIGVLTEGWDAPICDCIILARPTCSTGLYMQMIGRGLRTYQGKKDLLVIDHGGNIQRHGFIEDEREYTLADGFIQTPKKAADMPHTCMSCLAVFFGMSCPLCGANRQLTKQEITEQKKELEEITLREQPDEDKKKAYLSFIQWAKYTRRPPGAAYGRYKAKYGTAPKSEWQAGLVKWQGRTCLWV